VDYGARDADLADAFCAGKGKEGGKDALWGKVPVENGGEWAAGGRLEVDEVGGFTGLEAAGFIGETESIGAGLGGEVEQVGGVEKDSRGGEALEQVGLEAFL